MSDAKVIGEGVDTGAGHAASAAHPGKAVAAEVKGAAVGAAQATAAGAVAAIKEGAGGMVDAAHKAATAAVSGIADISAQVVKVAGAAGEIAGNIGGKLQGAGGIIASAAGDIAGDISGKLQGAAGVIADADMPIFPDIAVTSRVVDKARHLRDRILDEAEDLENVVTSFLSGKNLEVEIATGDDLDVRNFSVHERMSSLFHIHLMAISDNHSIDFDALVGLPARFAINGGKHGRMWSGVCSQFEQVRVEPTGKSTYQLSIVPDLWLLTQRKNYRMFQQISEPDIVLKVLKEWNIDPKVHIDRGAYKKRKYRVQYAETDFDFISRVLEDAGIAYYFEQEGDGTRLVLSDAAHTNPKRRGSLAFTDETSMVKKGYQETVTSVRMGQRVRPGKVTLRDHDYRRPPGYKLAASASGGREVESKLERFHYVPGAFLFGTDQGGGTAADDKGAARADEKEGAVLAQKRLDAERGGARSCTFETNAHDLAPGKVITMSNHPHAALGDDKKLLIVESAVSGTATGEWSHHCEARGADVPYRPEQVTPRPTVSGVESATVVGPPGEEIHTDEFGRVRVHFHWDRESKMDESSSCWIHVSQPWGGAGYGGTALPRVGQEVLVDFLGGDPDRPVIVGRLYTALQKTPYKLPDNKTQSGLKSNSTGGTGGYNEIMFEDAGGKELFRMQAEKDHHKLVKNDEQGRIGNNRSKSIGNDDSITIGNNRTSMVGSNNNELVGGNEGIIVAGNQNVTIGGNQSVNVIGNQHNNVLGNQKEDVIGKREATIVGPDKLDVLNTQDVTVKGAQTTTLKATQEVQITSNQNVKVGGEQGIIVTGAQTLSSSVMQTVKAPTQEIKADGSQTLKSTILSLDATAIATIKTVLLNMNGSAMTSLDTGALVIVSGPISITGGNISIQGGKVTINGAPVEINGGDQVTVTAGVIKLN